MKKVDIKKEVKKVLKKEATALLKCKIDNNFEKAIEIILNCKGKVIVTGLGKSGLIGQKISSTFSSTGTPSIFLHPVEAAHGDMGIIMKNDVVIIISQSGETEEVIELLPYLKRLDIPIIAITGKKNSTLAKKANCILNSYVKEEACPMGLAPTASTAVQLAIGDGLAVALLKLKGFKKEDFAMLHPGGSLGKKLILKVKDIMHTGDEVPFVNLNTKLKEAMLVMTNKRFGCTAIVDDKGSIAGIFTDGDLRRLFEKNENPYNMVMREIMTVNPKTINEDELAVAALSKMEKNAITVLLIPDNKNKLKGILHLHDILKSGVV
ncbi:MAG: KpsF/GutQ family sugar-phosphate isomerase [Candidatus Goldbacteria bacterium]|nr:KpsF/GutQ family sugar-phosphate isomerase [Candidatus Goldiibacteriota bacterium]